MTYIFCFTTLIYETSADCDGSDAYEERSYGCFHLSEQFMEMRYRYRGYILVYTDGNYVACATVFPSDTVIS